MIAVAELTLMFPKRLATDDATRIETADMALVTKKIVPS